MEANQRVDTQNFYIACDPTNTINFQDTLESRYYIDFSSVRGQNLMEEIKENIIRGGNQHTCQLFTGHIGCGKSTELRYLQKELEYIGFYVLYINADSSDSNLDLNDINITDILLLVARRVIEKQQEAFGFTIKASVLEEIMSQAGKILNTPIEFGLELNVVIGKITAKTKNNYDTRLSIRKLLEPRMTGIIDEINQKILEPTNKELQNRGKKGLVVIVDDLDRINRTINPNSHSLPNRLFVEGGEKLRGLKCHKIYTVPLELVYSKEGTQVAGRLGGEPKVLPMVSVMSRNGRNSYEKGVSELKKMMLRRAFPNLAFDDSLKLHGQVFNSLNTFERACQISGGHVRNFLTLIRDCLEQEYLLPISQSRLQNVIRENCDRMVSRVKDDEWQLILSVLKNQQVAGEQDCQTLLSSSFIFEYRDEKGRWFWLNPYLAETEKFNSLMRQ